MKVIQDYQTFIRQKYGGIAKVHFEIYNHLRKTEIDCRVCVIFPQCEYLSQTTKTYNYRNKVVRNVLLIINDIYTFFYCIIMSILGQPVDIIHVTWYKAMYIKPLFWLLGKKRPKLIVTVHDLIHEMIQDSEPVMKRGVRDRKSIMELADGIICVSENTKKDLIKYYPDMKNKLMKVIYPGATVCNANGIGLNLSFRYILYVGNRSGYKNFDNFVRGISDILNRNSDIIVFCAGGGNFSTSELKLFSDFGLDGRFIQKTVSEEELAYLYSKAICFVFPSLYEGFGLPTIEAFNYNCLVAMHNGSCFPEVAGDAAFYFNGNDIESIGDTINRILSGTDNKEKMLAEGKRRAQIFTWENTAKQTKDFYYTVIDNNNEYKQKK